MEREIAELMKLIRQLNTEQQLGVLMMSEGSNIIARNRKKRRITRRFRPELL